MKLSKNEKTLALIALAFAAVYFFYVKPKNDAKASKGSSDSPGSEGGAAEQTARDKRAAELLAQIRANAASSASVKVNSSSGLVRSGSGNLVFVEPPQQPDRDPPVVREPGATGSQILAEAGNEVGPMYRTRSADGSTVRSTGNVRFAEDTLTSVLDSPVH